MISRKVIVALSMYTFFSYSIEPEDANWKKAKPLMPRSVVTLCTSVNTILSPEKQIFMSQLIAQYYLSALNEWYPELSSYFPATYQESKERAIPLFYEMVYVINTLAVGTFISPTQIVSISYDALNGLKRLGTGMAEPWSYYTPLLNEIIQQGKKVNPSLVAELEAYYYCAQKMNSTEKNEYVEAFNRVTYADGDPYKTGMPIKVRHQALIESLLKSLNSPAVSEIIIAESDQLLYKLSRGKFLRTS